MNRSKTRDQARLCALIGALAISTVSARADYQSTVVANNPVGYWRLNETTQPPPADVATNSGSLAAIAAGYYLGNATHPVPGVLAGTDTAASYDGASGTATVIPYISAMNPRAAFTIEAWLNPTVEHAVGSGTLTCAISLGHLASPRSGWIIYQSETGWNLRMYAQNGTSTSVSITGGPAPAAGTWYHVVGVYDGTNAFVYVNGQQKATAAVPAYVPGTDGPFFIGGRSDSNYFWNGQADEVAFYDKVLSATEISAHYQNGISSSPSTPYDQLVKTSGPLAYYRLNEPTYTPPTTLPIAKNLGSLAATADGSYYPGAQAGAPGLTFTGFGTNNTSAGFNGVVGYVGTPISLNDLSQFTVMGWIKRGVAHSGRGGYFGQNDLLEFGDADSGANIEAWINAYSANIKIPFPFANNDWGLIALTGDGTQAVLYTNGVSAATLAGTAATYGNSAYNFNIGGGGIFNATGDYFLGNVDEVAVFDKALTAQQVNEIYNSANIPPRFVQQPVSPDRTLSEGNPLILTSLANGTPPLTYQWRKGGADLSGSTSNNLVFASLKVSDSGAYDLVARNAYGAVTSAIVNLTVRTADTNPPTILWAIPARDFNKLRVTFSEPMDQASAQTVTNYQLSGGLTISAAALTSPPGTPGDNMVDLTTSAQTPGQTYTLTVSGVKDQAAPPNPIAQGSSVQFTAYTQVPGELLVEYWSGISGNNVSDLTGNARYKAGTPDSVFTTTGINSRIYFIDDSHETYGERITGIITPKTTSNYTFFLRSDDASELWLSTNSVTSGLRKIAEETGCCKAFQEPGNPQTSDPIPLIAGQRYAVLVLHKEGTGGDYVQVAWRQENDSTAAADLQPIGSDVVSFYADPNAVVQFVKQPTDVPGTVPSSGVQYSTWDFKNGDGNFAVTNSAKPPPGPWAYDSQAGTWAAAGGESACSGPYNSQLDSPVLTLGSDGVYSLSFTHRYSFESPLWDAGQVRISVNGGDFTPVPADNFTENGYAPGNVQGTGVILGQRAFNGDSPGYSTNGFITSKALLGTFRQNDKLILQFVGAWDDCSTASVPGWEIASFKLDVIPMQVFDFAKNNGQFTAVNSTPPPPGPWTYVATNGAWVANGGESACSGPYNSVLNSSPTVFPQSGEVILNFTHRYSFEPTWDGGQLRLSVNGGPFTPVPAENFINNGYATTPMEGTGILKGQRAFTGDSAGYSTNGFITSSAILGTFNQGDNIVVQFAGAWDECTTQTVPGWVIKNVSFTFGSAPRPSTFNAQATASRYAQTLTASYQWQRDSGQGFVDIPNETAASYRFYPTAADFNAQFRVVAGVPGKSVPSNSVKLVQGVTPSAPELSIQGTATSITINFTGSLQSAPTATGPYQTLPNAKSPYVIPNPAGTQFFRSVK